MTATQTPPKINESWDEALSNALEDANAIDAYLALTEEQRAIASQFLANWSEHMDDGAPTPPSDPAGDDHRSEVAALRYHLKRAETKAEVYLGYVGNHYADKGMAIAAAEGELNRITR